MASSSPLFPVLRTATAAIYQHHSLCIFSVFAPPLTSRTENRERSEFPTVNKNSVLIVFVLGYQKIRWKPVLKRCNSVSPSTDTRIESKDGGQNSTARTTKAFLLDNFVIFLFSIILLTVSPNLSQVPMSHRDI